LENRRSKDDEMFREVWQVVETKARELMVAEAKRRRNKVREEETEKRGRKEEEKAKRGKNNGDEKVAKEWEIWDKKKEVEKSEEEAKRLVLKYFHK